MDLIKEAFGGSRSVRHGLIYPFVYWRNDVRHHLTENPIANFGGIQSCFLRYFIYGFVNSNSSRYFTYCLVNILAILSSMLPSAPFLTLLKKSRNEACAYATYADSSGQKFRWQRITQCQDTSGYANQDHAETGHHPLTLLKTTGTGALGFG